MISAERSDPGIFSVTVVTGFATGFGTLMCQGSMLCLLGSTGVVWEDAREKGRSQPDWRAAAAFPEVKIHLYGKAEPRRGRKMGHLVAFGGTTAVAVERARAARAALVGR